MNKKDLFWIVPMLLIALVAIFSMMIVLVASVQSDIVIHDFVLSSLDKVDSGEFHMISDINCLGYGEGSSRFSIGQTVFQIYDQKDTNMSVYKSPCSKNGSVDLWAVKEGTEMDVYKVRSFLPRFCIVPKGYSK